MDGCRSQGEAFDEKWPLLPVIEVMSSCKSEGAGRIWPRNVAEKSLAVSDRLFRGEGGHGTLVSASKGRGRRRDLLMYRSVEPEPGACASGNGVRPTRIAPHGRF